MSLPGPWICPTCDALVSTPYCATCGERPLNPRELTLRGLLAQLFAALSSIDSRLVRSLRCLVTRPGLLTLAWVRGQRKPYVGPIPLFLLANALFFVTQSMTHMNIFSSSLDSHLHHQDWRALAQSLVEQRLAAQGTTLELYAPLFDRAVVVNAKSLVVLMVLPFALVLALVSYRAQQPFVAHMVFSTHLYAFLLLLFCAALGIAAIEVALGGAGLESARMDNILSVLNLGVCVTWLYFATAVFYGAAGVVRVIQSVVLTVTASAIVLGYRFAVFLITLYST